MLQNQFVEYWLATNADSAFRKEFLQKHKPSLAVKQRKGQIVAKKIKCPM